MKRKIKKYKRCLAGCLVLIMMFELIVGKQFISKANSNDISGSVPKLTSDIELDLSNPIIENEKTKWDTIYFGNYWQNDTNGDGKANQSDAKTPIKWRILEIDGMEALLLADQCLDTQPYSDKAQFTSWEKSYLRNWLNTSFYNEAFSEEEKASILDSQVNNNGNIEEYAKNGNDTVDKVYLLSVEEIKNEQYGFPSEIKKYSESRVAFNTEYARGIEGAWNNSPDNQATWLLRTPVAYYFFSMVSTVTYLGAGSVFDGMHTPDTKSSVRPVIRIDLSKSDVWKYDKNYENGDITVKTPLKDSITDEQLFRDYPEYLDKSQQEYMMAEIFNTCSEVNTSRTTAENFYASAKYMLDDFNGIKTGVKWFMNKTVGTDSISDEYLDEVTKEFLEDFCRKPSNWEKQFKKAKSSYKKLSEWKGNLKDANKAEIALLLSKNGSYNEKTINKLAKELSKEWKKVDNIFKSAGAAIDFSEALTYVVFMESLQKDMIEELLQESGKRKDSTLYHGLQRIYDKLQHPYLSFAEKYIQKEGFKLVADQLQSIAEKSMGAFLEDYFGEAATASGGVVTLANLILTMVSKIMPGADADDVVKAQLSTTLFQELDSLLVRKQILFINRKKENKEMDIKAEIANYKLLFEARQTAAKKACEATEKIAKKHVKENLKKDKKLLEKFSYKKHIAGCKAQVNAVLKAQYTYKKEGKELAISGTVSDHGSGGFRMRKYKEASVISESNDMDTESTSDEILDNLLIIPRQVEEMKVTSVADKAFHGNTELEVVIIPDGITKIGEGAFENCTSLQKVYIGKDVKSIGDSAFAGCSSLNYVEVKGSVSEIGKKSFDQKNLTIVSSENKLLEQYAFDHGLSYEVLNKKIKSVEISHLPNRQSYKTEDELDEMGMELTVTYEDDSKEIITSGWSSFGFAEGPGEATIHVFYGGQIAEYSVLVEKGEIEYSIYCVNDSGILLDTIKKKSGFADKIRVEPPEIVGYDCLDESANIEPDFTDNEITFTYKKNEEKSLHDARVSMEQNIFDYTGQPVEPVPVVSLNGNILKKDVDYEVFYLDNIDIGTAFMFIFGNGTYNDMTVAEFVIKKNVENTTDKKQNDNNRDSFTGKKDNSSASSLLNNKDMIVNKKPGKIRSFSLKNKKKNRIFAKWKKVKAAKGYQIQYAVSKKKLNKGKRKNVQKTSATIKKLKKKKTYYVRVRAYKVVGDRHVYGKWSAVKKVKIRK